LTPEERERMFYLCQRIAVEKDHKIFSELVAELNELLNRKDQRLENIESTDKNWLYSQLDSIT
jgi:hypothetical protein